MKNKLRIYSTGLAAVALVLFLILVSSAATAASLTITETRITTSGLASYPAIYEDNIAYVVSSDFEPTYSIDVYDLSTKNVISASNYENANMLPDIYENRLVFDSVNGISVYTLSTKETQYIPNSWNGYDAKIYGDRIVWSNKDIYMYDLSTQKETQITINASAWSPDIYGDRIVWSNKEDIYMYDLSTQKETQITTSGSASNPCIYGDKIVYGRYGWEGDIYMYDLSTQKETRITTSGSASNPCIYGNRIVWQDWRDSDPYMSDKDNIYMYDLSTNTETRITTSGSAVNPDIYGDRIVWQDSRNGNSDIYMATLGYPTYPAADFSSNVTSGTAPLNVAFTDKSTGTPTAWNWSFGDGTANSTAQNPTHTYSTAGNYTVTLTVTNSAGSNTIAKSNYISATAPTTIKPPVIYFWGSRTSGTVPITIGFTDASTNTPTAWNWSFGDGTYSTLQNPRHTYTSAGTYSITLTAGNAGGNATKTRYNYITLTGTTTQKPVANFSSNVTSGNAPLSVLFSDTSTGTPTAWNWNFGDGTANATVKNPVHVYSKAGTYTVTLTVNNSAGSSTVTKSNYVTATAPTTAKLPVVYFWASRTTGTVPVTIGFTDASTNTPTAWNWNFGDGTYSTLQNPRHTYTSAGTYSITLTATNAAGSVTKTRSNYITLTGTTTQKPVASFSSNVTSGKVPFSVAFTDTSTGSPTAWNWNFGDGTANSTAKNPVHVYSKAGTYKVTLTVSNSAGSSTVAKSNYITATTSTTAKIPVVYFWASRTSGIVPITIGFTDASTNTPTSWKWNFGDGTYSTAQNPRHTYSKAGTYSITLTASNAAGSATKTRYNYIILK
jgi:beta propeller repeat protein